MREVFKLSPRLAKCSAYVPQNANFVDIGTDHGYLPIWLTLSGMVNSAIAADIGAEPLKSAQRNAEKYQIKIKTVLSNGFENIDENEFNCVTIAGMGGELISAIINNVKYLKNSKYTLILQPMTKAFKLREYLYDNGFAIECEETLKDSGKVYSVMKVHYETEDIPCFYMGKISPKSEFSDEYATSVIHHLSNELKSLSGDEFELKQAKINEIKEKFLNV